MRARRKWNDIKSGEKFWKAGIQNQQKTLSVFKVIFKQTN